MALLQSLLTRMHEERLFLFLFSPNCFLRLHSRNGVSVEREGGEPGKVASVFSSRISFDRCNRSKVSEDKERIRERCDVSPLHGTYRANKCDGQSPCGPCAVKNRVCRPYSRDLVFIVDTAPGPSGARPARQEKSSHKRLDWQPPVKLQDESTAVSSYHDQLLESFIHSYLSNFRTQEDLNDPWSFTWITYLPAVKGRGTAIDAGILSLATAGVGRRRQDTYLLKKATDKYGAALSALQGSISRRTPFLEDETILTSLTLIMYQLLREQEERKDWMTHAQGLSSIIFSRQPNTFEDGMSHNIFLASRIYISLAALYCSRSTFLGDEIWLTEPWKSKPKSDYQRMVDCMALLANVRARFSQLSGMTDLETRRQELWQIFQSCRDINKRFKQWYMSLPKEKGPLAIVDTTIWPPPDQANAAMNPFPQSFEYSSLKTANMLMTYWGSLIILLTIARVSCSSLAGIDVFPSHHTDPVGGKDPHWAFGTTSNQYGAHERDVLSQSLFQEFTDTSGDLDPVQLATRICMSIQFCLKQRPLGSHSTLFPLMMAIGCLRAHLPDKAPQLDWCYGVIARLRSPSPIQPWIPPRSSGKTINDRRHFEQPSHRSCWRHGSCPKPGFNVVFRDTLLRRKSKAAGKPPMGSKSPVFALLGRLNRYTPPTMTRDQGRSRSWIQESKILLRLMTATVNVPT
nr:hypothetical protein CFP56_62093 [Quercus suber]